MRRNEQLLDSFTSYCEANPNQRFWQALRNWVGWGFIYASNFSEEEMDSQGHLKDTFYWEVNKKENMN